MQRLGEFIEAHWLADVAVRMEPVGFVDVLLGLRSREDDHRDDFQIGVGLDLGEHFLAVFTRHVQVEQNHVRAGCIHILAALPQELHGLDPVVHHMQRVQHLRVAEAFSRAINTSVGLSSAIRMTTGRSAKELFMRLFSFPGW